MAVFHEEALRARGVPRRIQEFDGDPTDLEVVASIEVKPGVPPTPNHLAKVIADMKAKDVKVILIAPWSHNSHVERVAEATGAKIVEVPNQAGGSSESKIGTMDVIHRRLAAAYGG